MVWKLYLFFLAYFASVGAGMVSLLDFVYCLAAYQEREITCFR